MNRPRIYLQGETFDIGLKWTDLSKEAVDVSDATDIRVSIVSNVFKKTAMSFSMKEEGMVVDEDKCLINVPSEKTMKLHGLYYMVIEIDYGGQTEKAIADTMLLFVKPN